MLLKFGDFHPIFSLSRAKLNTDAQIFFQVAFQNLVNPDSTSVPSTLLVLANVPQDSSCKAQWQRLYGSGYEARWYKPGFVSLLQ